MRVCSVSGCPTLYDSTSTRCPTHSRQASNNRGSRGYNTAAHRRFRTAVLTRDPICVICGNAQATVADHYPHSRKELLDQGKDANNPAYGRGLCTPCHNRSTAQLQPGGWANQ